MLQVRRSTRRRRSRAAVRLAWLTCLAAPVTACGEAGTARSHPDTILEVDGLRIRQDELSELADYLRGVDARAGRLRIAAKALEHLIPLHLARREFAGPRAELRARAEALRDAVGNGGYPELVVKSRLVGGYSPPRPFARHELPLPVARWAFDEARIGSVSPVLETPQGFCLVATREILRGVTRTGDRADALLVPFYTHSAKEFGAWWTHARARLRGRVTYVHPDYVRALPAWLLPENSR